MPTNLIADLDDFERRIEQFEQAWMQGDVPNLSDFLSMSGEASSDRRALLVELVKVDLEFRWRLASASSGARSDAEQDQQPRPQLLEDYVARYPELASCGDLPLQLVGEEYRVRHRWGDSPSQREYEERFPAAAARIRQLLAKVDEQLLADTSVSVDETASARLAASGERQVAVPETIGKYHLVGLLDSGGQASVYRAVHPTLQREVVIKVVERALAADEESRARLIAEGQLLAELQHPHIAQVYDLDVDGGRPFLVMEFVRGVNLAQFVKQNEWDPRRMAALLSDVAHALSTAHGRGVVHQDVKPANILVESDGSAKLIDFGLARLRDAWTGAHEEPGAISGTATYMAPEQARGETANVLPASDLFSLGAVLYFCLTGQAPFAGRNVYECLERAQRCDFDATLLEQAKIPAAARKICLKAMAADPAERFATAEEFARELGKVARRPQRAVMQWAGLLLLAMVLGTVWMVWASARHGDEVQLVTGPADIAAVSRHPDGRDLRQDFRLKVDMPGGNYGSAGRILYKEGQRFIIAADTARDCYIGLWYLDQDRTPTVLFPHFGQDPVLRTGVPRELYRSSVTSSNGAEYIHIVASDHPLDTLYQQQFEPYVTREVIQDEYRGLVPLTEKEAAVAEVYVRFEVEGDGPQTTAD